MELIKNENIRLLLKVTLVSLLLVSLINQFGQLDIKTEDWILVLEQFNSSWYLLVLALVFMPLNWYAESLKWYISMPKGAFPSILSAVKGLLMGVSVSLVTPNRMGEYFGRVLGVKREARNAVVTTTLLGGLAQNLITWSMGLCSLLVLWAQGSSLFSDINPFYFLFIPLVLIAGFVFFFRLKGVYQLFQRGMDRWPWLGRLNKYIAVLNELESGILNKLLLLSFFRYFFYSTQYVILLYFFGMEAPLYLCYAGVALIFFLQASVPLPAGMALVMRGNVSLYVWGLMSGQAFLGVLASYLLFVINFSLSALLGVYYFMKTRIIEKEPEPIEELV